MEIKELLEKAAKACGVNLQWDGDIPKEVINHWSGNPEDGGETRFYDWNPATDDGDCARMEAELGINISWWTGEVTADACEYTDAFCNQYYKDFGGDKQAARRMASLRVAAAIYDSMG